MISKNKQLPIKMTRSIDITFKQNEFHLLEQNQKYANEKYVNDIEKKEREDILRYLCSKGKEEM